MLRIFFAHVTLSLVFGNSTLSNAVAGAKRVGWLMAFLRHDEALHEAFLHASASIQKKCALLEEWSRHWELLCCHFSKILYMIDCAVSYKSVLDI